MLCDKHLIKMILESAQLLCGPYEPGEAPYKRTHYNHPCSKWIRESKDNYLWLYRHAVAMCSEYYKYYKKTHKCNWIIFWCTENMEKLNLPEIGLTPFVQAMPEEYKQSDCVQAYRNYYIGEKASFAKWSRGRKIPDWWENKKNEIK